MKISLVTNSHAQNVVVDGKDYFRLGPDSWYRWYGNTLEPEFYEEEVLALEKAYKQYTLDSIPK